MYANYVAQCSIQSHLKVGFVIKMVSDKVAKSLIVL